MSFLILLLLLLTARGWYMWFLPWLKRRFNSIDCFFAHHTAPTVELLAVLIIRVWIEKHVRINFPTPRILKFHTKTSQEYQRRNRCLNKFSRKCSRKWNFNFLWNEDIQHTHEIVIAMKRSRSNHYFIHGTRTKQINLQRERNRKRKSVFESHFAILLCFVLNSVFFFACLSLRHLI